jgi:hypothetical protein
VLQLLRLSYMVNADQGWMAGHGFLDSPDSDTDQGVESGDSTNVGLNLDKALFIKNGNQ